VTAAPSRRPNASIAGGKPASTCASCFGWGVLDSRFCGTCWSFHYLHEQGECRSCHRTVAVRAGYCRLCRVQASRDAYGRSREYQWFLERVRNHQLAFVGMRRMRPRIPRPGDNPILSEPRSGAARRPVGPEGQRRLLDVPKDFTRVEAARHANHDNPWVIRARRATHRLGQAHGWSQGTQFQVNQALVILLSGHCDGDVVRYSELFPVARRLASVKRTVEVLVDLGVYEDDRTPTLDGWLAQRLAGLAPAIGADVDAWARALVEGGPRSRPRNRRTLHTYLHYMQPVLVDWSQHYEHLREVTHDDVLAARNARQGAIRETTIVGLRSLFGYCKRTGRVFRDPTSRVKTARRAKPVPLPLQAHELGQAVATAVSPANRVILALAGVHAARNGEIRRLCLDDIDSANRRLTIAGRVRPLDEPTRRALVDWLEDRRRRWPNTANPHLLVNPVTALGMEPVGKAWINQCVRGLAATLERLRVDRQLDEALVHGADPLHLAAVFDLDEGTALRYAAAARQLLESRAERD
jgi:hypothetical protein